MQYKYTHLAEQTGIGELIIYKDPITRQEPEGKALNHLSQSRATWQVLHAARRIRVGCRPLRSRRWRQTLAIRSSMSRH